MKVTFWLRFMKALLRIVPCEEYIPGNREIILISIFLCIQPADTFMAIKIYGGYLMMKVIFIRKQEAHPLVLKYALRHFAFKPMMKLTIVLFTIIDRKSVV